MKVFNEVFRIEVCPALLALSVIAIFALPNLVLLADYTCFRSVQYKRIAERNCKQNTTKSAFFLFSVAYKTRNNRIKTKTKT